MTPQRADVERAFTWARVRALTGLSKRQLQYWDEKNFIRPSMSRLRGRGRPRLYTFRDLVGLRVAADLRRQRFSLQLIRKVDRYLRSLDYAQPLSELRLFPYNGELYFEEAETVRAGRQPEQVVAMYHVPVAKIAEKLESDIAVMDRRRVGLFERRRGALGSKQVFIGTRISVDSVRGMIGAGLSDEAIASIYPDLEPGDLAAVRKETPPRHPRHAATG